MTLATFFKKGDAFLSFSLRLIHTLLLACSHCHINSFVMAEEEAETTMDCQTIVLTCLGEHTDRVIECIVEKMKVCAFAIHDSPFD